MFFVVTVSNEKKVDEETEILRKEFIDRVKKEHGDIGDAAEGLGISRTTFWRWRKTNGPLPDISEIKKLANRLGESTPWLAYGIGPRDPAALSLGLSLAGELSTDAGLMAVIDGYKKSAPERRALLVSLATALTATTSPAPLSDVSSSPPTPEAVRDHIEEMLHDYRLSLPAETPEYKEAAAAAKVLKRLFDARLSATNPAAARIAADSAAAHAAVGAAVSTPHDTPPNHLQSSTHPRKPKNKNTA